MTRRTLIIKIKQEITFTSLNISDIENPSLVCEFRTVFPIYAAEQPRQENS